MLKKSLNSTDYTVYTSSVKAVKIDNELHGAAKLAITLGPKNRPQRLQSLIDTWLRESPDAKVWLAKYTRSRRKHRVA